MKISIIIPTYNRASLIGRTIQSVLNQTSEQWELIVVDDGSTDSTKDDVMKFDTDKIRYIKQENSGANSARNRGATLATSDLLAFLDSDDELLPTWVEEVGMAASNIDAIVCCGVIKCDGKDEVILNPKSLGIGFNNIVGKFTNGASYAINKNLFWEVGGFDEKLRSGQHTELSFRLRSRIVANKVQIVNLMKPLVKVNIHEGPRIRSSSESKLLGALHIMEKHADLMKKFPILGRTYSRIVLFHSLELHLYSVSIKAGWQYLISSIRIALRK